MHEFGKTLDIYFFFFLDFTILNCKDVFVSCQGLSKTYTCFFREVDLIVEVAHPSITKEYGEQFIQHADYLVRFS